MRIWVCHPNTCIHVRLLGPCFKTGRLKPCCQHPKPGPCLDMAVRRTARKQSAEAVCLCPVRTPACSKVCPVLPSSVWPLRIMLSKLGPSRHKAKRNPTKSCQLFPQCQTDVDLPTRLQTGSNPATLGAENPAQRVSRSLRLPRQPRLVSSVSLSTISRPFHSLFRVLFIFPSRYLFAIGLSPIFSLR